mgnify:CR=1 FL=1
MSENEMSVQVSVKEKDKYDNFSLGYYINYIHSGIMLRL